MGLLALRERRSQGVGVGVVERGRGVGRTEREIGIGTRVGKLADGVDRTDSALMISLEREGG
jgi:hypothetical protein